MAAAQVHAPGAAAHAVIERGVGGDPALQLLQRGPAGGRRLALAAELGLAVGPESPAVTPAAVLSGPWPTWMVRLTKLQAVHALRIASE